MRNKDEVARKLAEVHYEVEPGMRKIFRLWAGDQKELEPAEPIKLLEVNESTIPSGIMPLTFAALPDRGIDYPSVIVEITPEEYTQIEAHELKLPEGWSIGDLLPRPTGNGDE